MFGTFSTTTERRRRRRPQLSCLECRRRKVRCDRSSPCGQCRKIKSLTCTYGHHEPTLVEAEDRGALSSSDQEVGRVARSIIPSGPLESRRGISSRLPSFGSHGEASLAQIPGHKTFLEPAAEDTGKGRLVEDLLDRIKNLEDRLNEANISKSPPKVEDPAASKKERCGFGPFSCQTVPGNLSKTRFFGQSHWMGTLTQFEKVLSFRFSSDLGPVPVPRGQQDGRSNTAQALLAECKNLSRYSKKQLQPVRWVMDPLFQDSVPDRSVTDELVDLYFKTFESTYRVLHIPTFRKEYEQYWQTPQNASTPFIMKLVLVMAIGSRFYKNPQNEGPLRYLAQQWIFAAQSWLSAPFEKSRLNLDGLQVHCLLLLARNVNYVSADLIWISAGTLLRMAIQMGYHRDPTRFPQIPVFQIEIRRRIWATILELMVQTSLDSGMPPMISCNDFDTEPPSNINDIEIWENCTTPPVSKPSNVFTQTSLQIKLRDTLRYRVAVSRILNDFRSQPPYDEVLKLSGDLTAVQRDAVTFVAPAHHSSDNENIPMGPTQLQLNLITMFILRFLLILHRPFAIKARTEPRFYFSRKVCLDTALKLVSLPQDEHYARLLSLAGGVYRETPIHAAVSMCLELITQLEVDEIFQPLSIPSRERSAQAKDPLSAFNLINNLAPRITSPSNLSAMSGIDTPYQISSPSAAAHLPYIQGIQSVILLQEARLAEPFGENNVKAHLFLSMTLAQILAMQDSRPLEQTISDAAHKSTTTCHTIMRARVVATALASEQASPPTSTSSPNVSNSPYSTTTPSVPLFGRHLPKPHMGPEGHMSMDMLLGRNQAVYGNGLGSSLIPPPLSSQVDLPDFDPNIMNLDLDIPDSWLFSGWEANAFPGNGGADSWS